MDRISLHGPASDKRGAFRDAGSVLAVGEGEDHDISPAVAADLIAAHRAVAVDPLDHDADGRRGGSLPRS